MSEAVATITVIPGVACILLAQLPYLRDDLGKQIGLYPGRVQSYDSHSHHHSA